MSASRALALKLGTPDDDPVVFARARQGAGSAGVQLAPFHFQVQLEKVVATGQFDMPPFIEHVLRLTLAITGKDPYLVQPAGTNINLHFSTQGALVTNSGRRKARTLAGAHLDGLASLIADESIRTAYDKDINVSQPYGSNFSLQ